MASGKTSSREAVEEVRRIMPRTKGLHPNIAAFLDMIAYSEGTAGHGDDGYNIVVGYETFNSYEDHPRKIVRLPKLGVSSTAAGRYQLLARYFTAYKNQLDLDDFSPEAQDAIAIQQIKECKAIKDIEAGRLSVAIAKCKRIWASLPGSGYDQPERSFKDVKMAYLNAGGAIA